MASEQEMMADLASADAAGDTQLAQHIAGQIKALRVPSDPNVPRFRDPDIQTLANAISPHVVAKALPMAGGTIGGALGVAGGVPTGPGALATGTAGAFLGSSLGRALQKQIDLSLGYEKPQSTLQSLSDVTGTGLENAASAAGGQLLTVGMAKLAPAAAALLNRGALATGRRVLSNVSGSLSKAKPLSDEAVEAAFRSGAFKFGGTSAGAAERLEAAREGMGQQYAQILADLEKQGITGPDAAGLAGQIAKRAQTVSAGNINPAVPGVYQSAAEQIAGKPTTAGRLGLSQAEQLKRSAQGMAKSAYRQMQPSEVGQAHEEVASTLRQAVEDEIAKQAPEAGGQFVPVKQELSKLIEASNAAREGMAREGRRSFFSLPDVAMAGANLARGGNPITGAAASHLLRSRGPSSAAVLLRGLSGAAEAVPSVAPAAQRATIALSPAVAAALNEEMPSAPRLQQLLAGLQQKRSDQLGGNP